jgi:beta-mannanase
MERLNLASVVHSPAAFIAAWDHTRAIFNDVGVTNASWVWCPTSTGFDQGTAQAYYPGANEVDWICTDAYPWPPGADEDLQDELAAFMAWAVPQGKPIMVGEVGVPLSYSVDLRNQWIDNAAAYLTSTPAIKAFVYFDFNPPDHPIERDWLLPPGSEALSHFRTLANNPWFHPALPPRVQPTSG